MNGLLGFLWVKIVAQEITDALPFDMQEQINSDSKLKEQNIENITSTCYK